MHSAMSVVTRLCGKMEPQDSDLPQCAESLGILLGHDDAKVPFLIQSPFKLTLGLRVGITLLCRPDGSFHP